MKLMPRSGRTARAGALLALRQPPVAADVAVLAAGDHVDGVLVATTFLILRTVAASTRASAARAQHVLGAVAELELDRAAVDEVGLLLLVVDSGGRSRSPAASTIALMPKAVTPSARRILRKP